MNRTPPDGSETSARSARRTAAAAAVLIAVAAAVVGGPVVLLACVALLFVIAYLELRRVLSGGLEGGVLLGAVAVAASAWLGYVGRPGELPRVLAALVLAVFVARIVRIELGRRIVGGITADLGSTVAAAGIVGLLGAHVLLIRGLPVVGFRGLAVFALMLVAGWTLAAAVGHVGGGRPVMPRLSPRRTWQGMAASAVAACGVGVVAGIVADPPFDITSGALLGAVTGLLVPTGGLAVDGLERSAGTARSGSYLPGRRGLLDATAGLLFSAPVFYWTLRTFVH